VINQHLFRKTNSQPETPVQHESTRDRKARSAVCVSLYYILQKQTRCRYTAPYMLACESARRPSQSKSSQSKSFACLPIIIDAALFSPLSRSYSDRNRTCGSRLSWKNRFSLLSMWLFFPYHPPRSPVRSMQFIQSCWYWSSPEHKLARARVPSCLVVRVKRSRTYYVVVLRAIFFRQGPSPLMC